MEDHRLHQSSLKIIQVCTVSVTPPSESSSSALNSFPLTFFDILWLRFHPIQRLFFYDNKTITHKIFTETIIPKLKHSLSIVLQHYLPLTGNLIWPQESSIPTIQFLQNDGVEFTVAESDGDFYHLSGNGFRDLTEYHPLVPGLSMSNDSVSLISIQVTLFPERGFSIGITNHHAVMDGKTSTSFIRSWARICSSTTQMIEPTPMFDRTVINDYAGLTAIYVNDWLNLDNGPNNKSLNLHIPKTEPGSIRCTLELTREDLRKLKKWVLILNPTRFINRLSSFVVATAYLCLCSAKSEGITDKKKLDFTFAVDARARLKPPIPENYFGNCVTGCHVSMERKELLKENGVGLAMAVETITESIKSLEDGVLNGAEKSSSNLISAISDDVVDAGVKRISIAGSPRFNVYGIDFGWGKPRKVEIVSIEWSLGAFALCDRKNGDDGMEIGFAGKRSDVEKFSALFSKGLESL